MRLERTRFRAVNAGAAGAAGAAGGGTEVPESKKKTAQTNIAKRVRKKIQKKIGE